MNTRVAASAAAACGLIAAVAILGWATRTPALTGGFAQSIAMQPISAVALGLGAVSLACAAAQSRWLHLPPALLLAVMGATMLLAYVLSAPLALDLLLFPEAVRAQSPEPLYLGRSNPVAAAVFLMLGVSLLLVRTPTLKAGVVVVGLAGAALVLGGMSLIAYVVLHGDPLRVLPAVLATPLNSAIAITSLSVGVMALRPDKGWLRTILGADESGRLARALLPVAAIPVVVAVLANIGVGLGHYGPDTRLVLIVEVCAGAFVALALWASRRFGRIWHEQAVADAALAESEERLAQAVATYELGIFDYDAVADRATFSPEFERQLGLAPGSLKSLADLRAMIPADQMALIETEMAQDIAAGVRRRETLTVRRNAQGELRNFRGVRQYIYDDAGRYIRFISIQQDVTAETKQREELLRRGERLKEMGSELAHFSRLSAMGEMAAALAHELNQPLTAVGNTVGAISLMLKNPEASLQGGVRDRILTAAQRAEAQAVRAGEIVRRLRTFIARGEADTRLEDVGAMIDDSLALALPSPRVSGIRVSRQIDPDVGQVLADRVQVQQVLVNLIRNAGEALREHPGDREIRLIAKRRGDFAELVVADNGPGVPEGVAEQLFTPFVSTKSDGMGVGLSISRRIVEAHGGSLWHQPGPDGGAEFHLTLSLITSEAKDV